MSRGTGVPLAWPGYKPKTHNVVEPSAIKPKAPVVPEQNPALKMLGLPRIRLPSRNWMIFFGITGSFAGAIYYDRYQTKRVQQKWCDLVRPLADEIVSPNALPRKLTIYVSAPPADGLRSAREHFYEYVKPILVAGAMEWEVIEGRREGDIRYGTAERIRTRRRRAEGVKAEDESEDEEKAQVIDNMRQAAGINEFAGPGGDLVIGRHAWKEYVRGVHEGWLGPLNKPAEVEASAPTTVSDATTSEAPLKSADGHAHSSVGDAVVDAAATISQNKPSVDDQGTDSASTPAASELAAEPANEETKEMTKEETKEEAPKPKLTKPSSYIATSDYASASTPSSLPTTLDPVSPIPFPHILGFLNTHIRTYRFLTQRHLADDVGRRVAGLVLASQSRSFNTGVLNEDGYAAPEQSMVLEREENEWHKSVRQKKREEGEESPLLDRMVIDERIGSRMRLWEVRQVDEEKANALFIAPPEKAENDSKA